MTKWARKSTPKECKEFKSQRTEVRKIENEDCLRKLDDAKIKEVLEISAANC